MEYGQIQANLGLAPQTKILKNFLKMRSIIARKKKYVIVSNPNIMMKRRKLDAED
jgi:hypothetical protein